MKKRATNISKPGPRGKGVFTIIEFANATGSKAFRVSGWTPQGMRIRKNFASHEEAVAKMQELEIEAANLATAARPVVTRLTAEQAAEAESAFSQLEGRSLSDAVRFYLDNYREPVRKITVKDGFEQFIQERESANLRPASIASLRHKCAELTREHGNRVLAEIGVETLRQLIFKPTRGPKSRDNHRRAIHAFFAWAMKQGYVGENPASKILPIKVDRNEPEILTVEQSKALIKAAQHYKHGVLLPYIAIGLFAGLRPTELSRLDWQRIDLKDHTITLGADMAKMRAKRIIELSDNLVAWLTPLAQSKPQIVKANFRRDFTAVKKLAGWGPTTKEIPNRRPLPQDIMRHTAISNHLAFYQHEGKTAAWAGNSPDIIQRHYKGLIKQAESQEFWNIRPEC